MSIIIRPKDPEYSSVLVELKLYDAVSPCEDREIDTIFGEAIDFATLVEKFEEVKRPLIKDEKIRKAVRAWAEANSLKNVAFEDYDDENIYFIDRDYEPQIWFPKKSILESPLDDGKIYTISELCGEEKE